MLGELELPLFAILRPPPSEAETGLTREWLPIAGPPALCLFPVHIIQEGRVKNFELNCPKKGPEVFLVERMVPEGNGTPWEVSRGTVTYLW